MKTPSTQQAIQYVQAVGVAGLVSGVRTGMLTPAKAATALRAVGAAVDSYSEMTPLSDGLADLQSSLHELPQKGVIAVDLQSAILEQLAAQEAEVHNVLQAHSLSSATAIGAPFDLHPELCWIPKAEFKMKSGDMVTAGRFFLLDHIVSNAEFQVFLRAAGRGEPRHPWEITRYDQPALAVHPRDALAYSKWWGKEVTTWTGHEMNGRLPTEVEWWRGAIGSADDVFDGENSLWLATIHALNVNGFNVYGLKDMFGKAWQITSTPLKDWSDRGILASVMRSEECTDLWGAMPNLDSAHVYGGFRPLLEPKNS